MRYAAHVGLGVGCWGVYAAIVNSYAPETVIGVVDACLMLPVVAIASLLPDIDHPESKLGRRIKPISTILSLFSHRGITHSLWAVGLMVWLLASHQADSIASQALVIGYLSHLLGDAVTPAGIRPFWPLGRAQRIGLNHAVVASVGIILFLRWMY
ncbi:MULTISPECIES: metal-dependent hydrolase [Shewanella]|jgi:inner membrane protein|uniref:Metal-dependent hydrolase n=2 Tax=Shewanella TaxID=22 RepID=A0A5B8R3T0_9GAMM|nr:MULTISPECIES: metal-dependent hydrolase [Shewanella]QXN27326.1 metal-dependent hydrolase [Shewanella putrefaciens]MBW0282203.1 metal-dependent hydrolase [Shewanella xiamenensis]MCB2384164.1 metal-dependent hydrolase [Shewanella sp. SR1]MCS6116219.1 metal-dependent hydrolase [Shewanella baltica]MCS6128779.1 metal-dependent hydrolase [Shewanella baltica]